jgi:hypothetical protein
MYNIKNSLIAFASIACTTFAFGHGVVGFKYTDVIAETKKGLELGIGTAHLTSASEMEVSTWQTVTLRYTAGKAGIEPGGGVRFTFMHGHRWTTFQMKDPQAPGYTTVECSNGAPVEVFNALDKDYYEIADTEYVHDYDPYYKVFEVIVKEKGLKEGESIELIFGEQSAGSPGVYIQYFDEHPLHIETYVDPKGKGRFYPMADYPTVEIVAAAPAKLNMVTPSNAVVGKPTWCIVRAEDLYGNIAPEYSGDVSLESNGKAAGVRKKKTFGIDEKGVYEFKEVVFKKPGLFKLKASDGNWLAESNPISVTEEEPALRIFWGDIHNHTKSCDARGTTEQSYAYARHCSGLDFCSITNHSENLRDIEWIEYKQITKRFHEPGRFVTIPAYEWSGSYATGGDHNVYFMDDDPPIYRSRANFTYTSFNNYQGSDIQANHVEDLYLMLARHYTDKNIFITPHWGGRRGNNLWHNPTLERLIEVFSDHQRSEDWTQGYLSAGHKLGIMASSDGHIGKPGYSNTYPKTLKDDIRDIDWDKEEIGTSLIAVYAGALERKDIFDAMYDRHCYATTGDRILLDFSVNRHVMGQEIETAGPPEIRINVVGTSDISTVEIKRNNTVVKAFSPGTDTFKTTWVDENYDPNNPLYYYVRIIQANNEEAISSPVWIEGASNGE